MIGAASAATAAPPTVRNLDIRGLQIGATTTIAFDGIDFPPNARVMMAVPIAAQTVRPNATATRVEIDVTLDGGISPGFYNLYLAGEGGVSEKTVVALDRLPQRRFGPTVEALPVALHGTLSGSPTLRTTFAAKAGQRLICEVESQRLAGKLRPVLHLYDAQERHIAWSLPSPVLHGDTRLVVTVPADGQYTLTLNDLQFAAQAPGHFRLKIGDWQYADAAFPAAVQRGTTASLRLIGSLPADKVVALAATSESLWSPAPWPAGVSASGPSPAVSFSDVPEVLEQPVGEALQEFPAIPAAIHGRLSAAGEEDRYRIKAPADTKLRCEVFAARLSAPIDTIVEIRRPDGALLAANDDTPGTTDSLVDFTVPKDVDSLIVAVRDAQGRGGEAAIYRVLIAPADAPPADFQLSVESDAYNVVQNARQVVRLRVDRKGYEGPIGLRFGQLPWGVTIDAAEIPAGMNGKLVTLTASADAPQCRLTTVRGRALAGPQRAMCRTALAGASAIRRDQPWLAAELPVSLAARGGVGFDADWQPAADAKLVLGGKFAAPTRCLRPAGFDGPVRLTLLTSQNPPQVNGVDDANRTLRPEPNAPVEIPPDAQAVNFNMAVPADLPPGMVEIAFRAELLSRDRQRVLMTVCTPVRRVATFNPLRVQYSGAKVSVKLDRQSGAVVKLAGKIERLEGLASNITVTVAGLPPGVAVPRLVVPAAQTDFELDLKFPAAMPAGVMNGLQLIASGKMAANSPIEVRSEPVTVVIELLPPDVVEKR
ncbi:MAG TPA: hypothetical protein PK867_11340 [Pirellulales bacterium]|nr:hypothetical protein [Pirellulales bacterium]